MLDFPEMRQLAIRVGVDKSRLMSLVKSRVGRKALAYSDIAVPSHVADLEAVTKMRHESGRLESISTNGRMLVPYGRTQIGVRRRWRDVGQR